MISEKNEKRTWVLYERTYSNSMWQAGWKHLDDGRYLICYQDDASRFIVGYGLFKTQTSKAAISVLKKAIKKHGKPASILTGKGTWCYAKESEYKKRGATLFEKELVKLDIKHILFGINSMQTNGKLAQFYGVIQRKLKRFKSVPEIIQWHNDLKPHRSLSMEELETPSMAFKRMMPESVEGIERQTENK